MVKKLRFIAFGIMLTTLVFSSCYYDVEQELYPVSTCDTVNMSLYNDVIPILETHCLVCHNNTNFNVLGGDVDLDGYADLKVYVTSGKLMSSLRHDGNASPMPKGATQPIPPCEIRKINAWINDGARDQ